MQYIWTSLCNILKLINNVICQLYLKKQRKGKTTFIAIVLRELSQSCESLLEIQNLRTPQTCLSSISQSCLTPGNPMNCGLPGSSPYWASQASTLVGCHFPLQRISPIQGLSWCLLHWQVDSLPLEQPGKLPAPQPAESEVSSPPELPS